jgi:predicted  nucleic acid-binding Zn-ribbon protein
MDDETRAAFARIDRWFELGQQQHLGLQQQVTGLQEQFTGLQEQQTEFRQELTEMRSEMDRRFTALEHELRSLRDWVTAAIADLRSAVQQILLRLDRLERSQGDPYG